MSVTAFAPLAKPAPVSSRRPGWALPPGPGWLARCYLAFAGYALAAGLLGGDAVQRWWGIGAATGYGAAAAAAGLWRSRGRDLALTLALAGSIAAPLAWQQMAGHGRTTGMESALAVVARSARLLLAHGSPYLSAAHLSHPLSYDPYLPVMAIFGLPGALGLPGAAANPRLWFGLTAAVALWLAFRRAVPGCALWLTAFALGSPVLAFGIVAGDTDVPVLALLCLALAVASPATTRDRASRQLRPRPVAAGLITGAACAMKATAWPVPVVLTAMLAAGGGRRDALRYGTAAAGACIGGVLAAAPVMLTRPASLVPNTILFPLGLTRQKTPAASPLPGHLLASAGAAGHWAALALLGAAGAAITVSLVTMPPLDVPAAVRRLVLGMTLMIMLAPATRWGYFTYPAGLLGWLAITRPGQPPRIRHERAEGLDSKEASTCGARWPRAAAAAARRLGRTSRVSPRNDRPGHSPGRPGSPAGHKLAASGDSSFVHAMHITTLISAASTLLGAAVVMIWMPGRPARACAGAQAAAGETAEPAAVEG